MRGDEPFNFRVLLYPSVLALPIHSSSEIAAVNQAFDSSSARGQMSEIRINEMVRRRVG